MILHPLILLPFVSAFPVVDNDLYNTNLGSSFVFVSADQGDQSFTVDVRDRATKAEVLKDLQLHSRDVDSADDHDVDSADDHDVDSTDDHDVDSAYHRAIEYLDKHNIDPAYKYDTDVNDNRISDVEDDTYEFVPLHARNVDTEEDPYRHVRPATLHSTYFGNWPRVAKFLKDHPKFMKLAIDTMSKNVNLRESKGLLKDKPVKRSDHQTEQLSPSYLMDNMETYMPAKKFIIGTSQLDVPELTLTELSKVGFELDQRFRARMSMKATAGPVEGFDTLFPGSGDRTVKIIYFDFPESANISDGCRTDFTKCIRNSDLSQAVNVTFVGGRLFEGKITLDFIPGARPASEPATRENALHKIQGCMLYHIAAIKLFDIFSHISDYVGASDADKPTFHNFNSDSDFSLQAFDGNDVFAEYIHVITGIGTYSPASSSIDPLVSGPEAFLEKAINTPVYSELRLVHSMSESNNNTSQSKPYKAPPNTPEDRYLSKRSPDLLH
ncbi:hypothetical protein CANCADRAFT_44116 [Tortispora caseinolytica NRRL Y-17796]|uniref:Uncharacterized protein n=1 Tax=Tortispora caseinolytica NRRL Y-17796 TaxID=767744 RepID=A0A1E4TFG3_9ASCO|nr:hypothetical protein CANCADRAFT_44116 [Tortispora caseinolytica NRRL Y-17796]